jgi:hypothetical protein
MFPANQTLYLYISETYAGGGTVGILVDIIKESPKFIPSIGCKYIEQLNY